MQLFYFVFCVNFSLKWEIKVSLRQTKGTLVWVLVKVYCARARETVKTEMEEKVRVWQTKFSFGQ